MIYNRRTVSIITPPATRPITVADMRAFLGIDGTQDDLMLEAFIDAANDAIRQYCGRSLVTETLELRMDGFPGYDEAAELALGPGMHVVSIPFIRNGGGAVVGLPFGPIASIVSVKTYGRDNSEAVFDADAYEFDASRLYLNEGRVWPSDLRKRDAVAIRYTSGSAPSAIPPAIIQAVKTHVAAMYECRSGCDMPAACKSMLAGYRRLDQLDW
jgi:hypothetical protein